MVIFPLVLFFVIGYLFKVHFSYPEQTGQILTRIILNVTLPATVFLASSTAGDFTQAFFLPIAALLIQLSMFVIFLVTAKKLSLDVHTQCVFITAPLISNILFFTAPFFYLAYGDQGLTRVVLYDIGNAITIYFVAQAMLKFYGKQSFNYLGGVKTILFSLPLWALALGLLARGLGLNIPEFILEPLQIIKDVNVFLPMFVLGFYFNPALNKFRLVLFTVLFRLFLGLLVGVGISFFFSNPIDKLTVIMAAAAPIGLLSLAFSSEYGRDTSFASNVVSYSMILGLIIFTIIDFYFRYLGVIIP